VEEESGPARGHWATAVGLTLAVIFLAVFDAVPLVALPLALLMMAVPAEQRWRWIAGGLILWVVAVLLPAGPVGALGRGWALLLGGAFLFVTLGRPDWGVLPRALTTVGVTFASATVWLLLSGSAAEVDSLVREHFRNVSTLAVGDLAERMPESAFVRELSGATDRMATLQWTLFPGILALQSLAALALASWWFARLRGVADGTHGLRPLREFRFPDPVIWLLVAGLVLLLAAPGGEATARAAYNLLFFIGSLYALRGVGVILFLIGRTPSWLAVVFAVLATIFVFPLVLTTTLLVGVGDTWLDVRGRARVAPPTDA
jgi:hypothetical protein